jgi:hypothetical protein
MAKDKEQARKIDEAIMVCKYPDVCKSPVTPVPYMIVSNFINSQEVATTVNATKDPTFTRASYIQGVIGDEGGVGGGVCSGTFAGGGACWAVDWAHNVRAEGKNVERNGDPTHMNGQSNKSNPNTQGTVVYPKSGAPNGGVGPDGKPTQDTNPGMRMRITQYGYADDATPDSNTEAGRGAFHSLDPDVSIALTKSAQKALGAKPGDWIKIEFKSGGTQVRRFDDRAPEKQARVDLYNPRGFVKGLDDYANVSVVPRTPDMD